MVEELQALVNDLASTVKNLQGELSELKKDRDGTADDSRQKSKRPRDDEDRLTGQSLTQRIPALAMARSAKTTATQVTLRTILLRRTQCQPRGKLSWKPLAPSVTTR